MPTTTAKQYLIKTIEDHREELILRICRQLQAYAHSHYETIPLERHQEREERFMDVILATLRDEQSEALSLYLEDLVVQRADEGYALQELEEAFNIVQETLWQALAKYWPIEESVIEGMVILKKLFKDVHSSLGPLYFQNSYKFSAEKFDGMRRKFAEYRHAKTGTL